ncbi:MAG: carboxypeptidase regulatory-like domain-containing protein [Thermoanaerobaculia bacterium]|nr:MAG: carboxypeptidase regulatory-like domain-containing protein [Thermoanaerobaculia bacterium]
MFRSPSPTIAELAAASALLALASGAAGAETWPWRSAHAAGEVVHVAGTVSDASGQPIEGLTVELEASSPRVDWRRLARDAGPLERRSARSSARGEFGLDWAWDPGFRRFELVVRLREEVAGRTLDLELARLDVTDRMTRSRAVAAALVVERAELVRRALAFLDSLRSDDERATWRDLGLPERIERVESPAGAESAWWYFEAGRVARFRDGRLAEIETFPPVRAPGAREPQ